MRYKEFIEGIRMGAKDLAMPAAKQYTIGFEFEVAVDSDFVDDNSYEFDDDDATDVYDEFVDQWYADNSFDFDDWFKENYLSGYGYQKNDLLKLISDNYIEPRYGLVTAEVQAEFENRKERQRLERVKLGLGDPEMFDKVIAILDKFEKDPAVFVQNTKEVVDFVHLFYILYKEDFSMSKESIKGKAEEIVQQRGYEVLQQNLGFYHEKMKGKFSYNETFSDELEDSVEMMYTDADQSDVVELDDIDDVEDFVKYFNVDVGDLRDYTQDQWSDAESELMNQEFNDWYQTRGNRGSGSKIGYVTAVVNDEFNTRASNVGSSKSEWAVIEDGTQGVDAEITTPAFTIDKGIAVMKKMLSIIENSGYMQTKSATGLHINIGTFTEEEANGIDWLKFLMIMNAERVLQQFDRVHNSYAPDKLPEIISSLQDNNLKNYMNEVQTINNIVRKLSEKYSAVNLSKLVKYGIIELRAPGNRNYETQAAYLEQTVKRIVRALELSSDPDKYKNEYLSMLAKRFGKAQSPVNRSALDNYFANAYGFRVGDSNPVSAIIRAIEYAGPGGRIIHTGDSDEIKPDKGYTLNVHKELMNLLRDYTNNTYTPLKIVQMILDALNKYDKNNVMRNSKIINLVIKEIGKS